MRLNLLPPLRSVTAFSPQAFDILEAALRSHAL